jgi:hypothetical protein
MKQPPLVRASRSYPPSNSNQWLKQYGHHFRNSLHCYTSNQSGLLQTPPLQDYDEYNSIFVQKLLKTKFQWVDYFVAKLTIFFFSSYIINA